MKHFYIGFSVILFIALLFQGRSAVAQNEAAIEKEKLFSDKAGTKELIIGMPKVSEKNLFIIEDAIKGIEGAEFVMFCPIHNLVLINYNPNKFAKGEDVLSVLKQKNINMPMMIKEGSFKDIQDLCSQ